MLFFLILFLIVGNFLFSQLFSILELDILYQIQHWGNLVLIGGLILLLVWIFGE